MAIYLMMDRDCVKVGFATDVKKRMNGYRTHNPHCVCIDFNEECSRTDEEVIHELMNNDSRFTRCNTTEWYQVESEELLKTIQMEKLGYFLKKANIVENNDELVSVEVAKAYKNRTPFVQYLITEGNAQIRNAIKKGYNSCTLHIDGEVDRLHHFTRRGACEIARDYFINAGYEASMYSDHKKIQIRW
jgi:hypothetical protein